MYGFLSLYLTFVFLIVFLISRGERQFSCINKRLKSTDAKLAAILNHLDIEWDILPEPSEEVKNLAQVPNSKIKALRVYRQQTGAGLREGVKVIEKLSSQEKNEA
jgi:ribosomal protein L7/L12